MNPINYLQNFDSNPINTLQNNLAGNLRNQGSAFNLQQAKQDAEKQAQYNLLKKQALETGDYSQLSQKDQQAFMQTQAMKQDMEKQAQYDLLKQQALKTGDYSKLDQQDQQAFMKTQAMKQQLVDKDAGRTAFGILRALKAGDPEAAKSIIANNADDINALGDQMFNVDSALQLVDADPEQLARMSQGIIQLTGFDAGIPKPVKEEKTKYQQGSGDMSGYSFNPDTGKYSVSESIKSKLEKAKEMPALDAKTRQGINKDLTQLTKDTKMIVNTAKDLEKLSKIKSGPASIAMVFKFMKALDPTSVVREGEFATAENSAGVPESVRNIYNKVMEGERLGDKQASQFVNTAKQLANTAIESSTGEVQSFVDTFEDTLTENFKKSLLKRVPKAFNIKPQGNTDVVIKSHPTYGDVTEDDIQTTMAQSGMTREQVLSKLGG